MLTSLFCITLDASRQRELPIRCVQDRAKLIAREGNIKAKQQGGSGARQGGGEHTSLLSSSACIQKRCVSMWYLKALIMVSAFDTRSDWATPRGYRRLGWREKDPLPSRRTPDKQTDRQTEPTRPWKSKSTGPSRVPRHIQTFLSPPGVAVPLLEVSRRWTRSAAIMAANRRSLECMSCPSRQQAMHEKVERQGMREGGGGVGMV